MSERENFYKSKLHDYPAYQAGLDIKDFISGLDAERLMQIAYYEGKIDFLKENLEYEKDKKNIWYINRAIESCEYFVNYFAGRNFNEKP